jgi:hypothetical protein
VVVGGGEPGPQVEPRRGQEPVQSWKGRLAPTGLIRGDRRLHRVRPGGQLGLGHPRPGASISDQRPGRLVPLLPDHHTSIYRIAYEPGQVLAKRA